MWMTRVSINNPVFATMVMVALCVLGLFSYQRLGVEQMPDISPPVVFIAVQLQNPKETMRAGEYAVAHVQIGDAQPRLTVPIGAISSASGQEYVWTVEQGKLLRRTVTTGRRDAARGRAEVLEGIKPDALVLGARFDNLREGAKARVVASATAATPTPLPEVAAAGPIVAR